MNRTKPHSAFPIPSSALIVAGPARRWAPAERAVFAVSGDKAGAGPVEVIINGYIGEDIWDDSGMSERKFLAALEGYENTRPLSVVINSMGGSVKEGLGIYNAIKRWQGQTTARISGFAVSIASVIPLACDRVISPKSSNWMIHDPLCMTGGNADDHRKSIEMLESCAATMAAIYAEKTGKSRAEMRKVMQAETWYTGEQAKATGLSDDVNDDVVEPKAAFMVAIGTTEEPAENLITELFDQFRNAPVRLVAALKPTHPPHTTTTTPPPTAAGQPPSTMQKDKIIALLKQHGKPVAADASDETILSALADLVTAGKVKQTEVDVLKQPEAKVLINADEFRRMEARLKEEKEHRIKQEFNTLAMDRPYLVADEWLPKLYAHEDLLETVRKMPVIAGVAPVAFSRAENNGNGVIEDYRKMKAGPARKAFALAHWNGLEEAHRSQHVQAMSSMSVHEQLRRLHDPRAANSYGASLVTDRLADGFITTIGTKLAALRGFSRDFGTDRLKPRATVQVPKVTVGSTTLTNATNFEQTDTTDTNVAVSVAQITQPWGVTNDELNKGHRLMTMVEKNAQAFSNAISDIWTALVTTANFGAATSIGSAASFDTAALAPIYALAKNYGQKNLILDGGHLAYLLPTDKFKFRLGEEGAYNFDLIAEQNRWTGATATTVGIICDPNAIAVCSGLPLDLPASEFIELGTVSVEELGLTVQVCHWFSRGGRVHYMSFDVMFGGAAGDTTAAELLTT